MRSPAWVLGLVLGVFGCKELPDIDAGTCGNQVLEPPEDCDGFPIDGVPCRPPGSVGECRLDCSPGATGEASECPAGWGCVAERICRPATGEFRLVAEDIPGNAEKLLAGDFDGDGREDIVGVERAIDFGLTKHRVHYFGDDATPAHTWTSDKLFASATVADVSDDGRSDIAYSFGNIGAVVGEPDRSLLPEAYPSYFIGPSEARAIVVHDGPVEDSAAFVILADLDQGNGIFVADFDSGALRRIAEANGSVEELAAEPVAGRLFEDQQSFPCMEFALAYRERTEVSVYSACELGDDDVIHWREAPLVTTVVLEPETPIDQGLLLADFDGDGHLDLLVGTAAGPYLARGNGVTIERARPYEIVVAPTAEDSMPLAAGDLNEDGMADLVFPDGLALANRDPDTEEVTYVDSHRKFGAPWSEALFADFNANGKLDVACASNIGLDINFYNGTGTSSVNAFSIPTDRAVEHLTFGDLDGDLINDLAFVQLRSLSSNEEEISVAFGRAVGQPDPPIPAAHLDDVRQISGFVSDPFTTLANLVVIFEQTNAEGEKEHALGFLAGSGDRSLPSLIELTTFAEDGSLESSTSLALAVGAFTHPGRMDLMPLGSLRFSSSAEYAIWLVQDIAVRGNAPQSIGWGLEPGTTPVGGPLGDNELSVRMTSGDLDGDGLDELVLVAPDESGSHCVLNTARVASSPEPELVEQRATVLDFPCYESQVGLADLDGDGAPELLVLVGDLDARDVLVLWNDGSGGFAENQMASLAVHAENPRAFTHFRAADSSTIVAYVTDIGIRLLRSSGDERTFEDMGIIAELGRGTGIVAADVNGDRIVDLVVADSGSVRVFKAVLAE